MRKKHLRLAKLLNQFHFTGAKHTDETVEGYIAAWCEMKGSVEKLAEVANVLDFCFQNRHFIRKYPQVVEMPHGKDSEAAFITFHALGGVYPLRKPGEARVPIEDHLFSQVIASVKADNLAAENGLVDIDGKQYCVSLKPGEIKWPAQPSQNQCFVGRLKPGAGKTGELPPERPVPNRSFDPDRYPTLDRALPEGSYTIEQLNRDEDLLNPAMKRMTAEELADWKQRTGEPGVKVSVDPDAPRNPDGSLNDLVILGTGRFGRPGILAGLCDTLNDQNNRSAAKALLPKNDTPEDREKKLNAEIRHTFKNNKL